MRLKKAILAILATANGNLAPLEDWTLGALNLRCGFSEKTVLTFEVVPGDIDFDQANVRAGNCAQADLTFSQTSVTGSDVDANGKSLFTVEYDPHVCMGVTADPADINSYASTVAFEFDFGYVVSGIRMNMRTYRIPATCEFSSSYDIRFDFGMLERPVVTVSPGDDSIEQPVHGGLGFNINVFKNADLTGEVFQTETNMKGGEMAYFTLQADSGIPSELRFAPPTCRFVNEACDAQSNCNELMGFDLFHFEQNQCQQPAGSPLNFAVSYEADDESPRWVSQFRLFLFNNDIDESTYVLRCSVEICVAACNDAVGSQRCNTIAQECLDDTEYLNFHGQCQQCGAGEQPNATNNGCDTCPVVTYNSNPTSIVPCESCPAGQVAPTGSTSSGACYTCDAGMVFVDATEVCESVCAAGKQQNAAKDGCEACPANTFNDISDSRAPCQACSAGMESETGQSFCVTPCGAGQHLNAAKDGCENCPANFYSSGDSIIPCTACDTGFVSDVGAADCRSPLTSMSTETTLTLHTPNNYNYQIVNVDLTNRNSIEFAGKVNNDGHVALITDGGDTSSGKFFEVVLGGWGNGQSTVRSSKQGGNHVAKGGAAWAGYNTFIYWRFSWGGSDLVVERGTTRDNYSEFMRLPNMINYVSSTTMGQIGFSTGWGSHGDWEIYN